MVAFPDPQQVITELMQVKEAGVFEDERMTAAGFVFAYGPLTETPSWGGHVDGTAFDQLTHWTIERGDCYPPGYENGHLPDCPVCAFLEAALGARYGFESPQYGTSRCRTCGGGLDDHRLVVEEATDLPYAVCVGRWQRFEPLAGQGGQVAEYQESDAWNAKWAAPLADGTWAVIYRTYYLACFKRVWFVERQDEYLTCYDVKDPGGTEYGGGDLRYVQVDSAHPKQENIHALATESFEPYPGEWQTYVTHSAAFANLESEDRR